MNRSLISISRKHCKVFLATGKANIREHPNVKLPQWISCEWKTSLELWATKICSLNFNEYEMNNAPPKKSCEKFHFRIHVSLSFVWNSIENMRRSDNDMRQVWRWLLIFRPNGRWQIITCWNRRFLQRLTGGKSTQCWHHFFYFCYYIHSFCNLIHVLRNSNPIDLVNGMDGFYLHYTNKYDTVVFINVISGIIFLCFVHWLDNLVHQITKQ